MLLGWGVGIKRSRTNNEIDPGYPKLPENPYHINPSTIYDITTQAGLLTPGSSYLLRLPDPKSSDFFATFVPGYSGGPVSDLHGVPS